MLLLLYLLKCNYPNHFFVWKMSEKQYHSILKSIWCWQNYIFCISAIAGNFVFFQTLLGWEFCQAVLTYHSTLSGCVNTLGWYHVASELLQHLYLKVKILGRKEMLVCLCIISCSVMSNSSVSPWTHQASLSMGFSRQDYWSGLLFPPSGDLPDPGIKPTSYVSPVLAGEFFTAETPGKPINFIRAHIFNLSKFITLSQCLDFCLTWIFIE